MALDRPHLVMVPATLADYPALQNLARFYVYDMSRYCGDLPGWECPEDGLYEAYDFRSYFETPDCFPFSLYAGDERAGFLVVKNIGVAGTALWNMEQFFVTAKFQRRGQGARLTQEVWTRFRGPWRIEVIPENAPALAFWQHLIDRQSAGNYRARAATGRHARGRCRADCLHLRKLTSPVREPSHSPSGATPPQLR